MALLTELTLYPIKSCGGIALQEARLTPTGLASGAVRDREWMLIDAQGRFITQRTHPKMTTIAPSLADGMMELNAPGMPPLSIPLDQQAPNLASIPVRVWRDELPAHDCGDHIAQWLSQVLDDDCRMVRFHPEAKRIANPKWTQGVESCNLFSDSFPFLLIAQASLNDLNTKLRAAGRDALPMNRFRPNLVIDGVDAFTEDRSHALQAGKALLKIVRPCTRCPIPSVDQKTGVVGPNPLDILKTYHTSATLNNATTFGMHAILGSGEGRVLRVGQTVELTFNA